MTKQQVKLYRVSSTDRGTLGFLEVDGTPICLTLEEPWRNNQQDISCVPCGKYIGVEHDGNLKKDVFRLENVPGRTGVLIHIGNTLKDTEGCILVGRGFKYVGDALFITESTVALALLRGLLKPPFDIEILYLTGE